MKRSRNHRYDRKRDRSKKDSKRKFTYGTKPQTKNSIDRLHDFQITENHEKKYRRRQIRPRKKSFFSQEKWTIAIVILLLLLFMIYLIY